MIWCVGGHNTDCSYISQGLVAHGYCVASIPHALPAAAPVPTVGNVREGRRPCWARGVHNTRFVRRALLRKYSGFDAAQLLLVGHPSGGDPALLFAEVHPALGAQVISLDNRRMPVPRATRPRVLALRLADQEADPGALPTPAEQSQFGTSTIPLKNVVHKDV